MGRQWFFIKIIENSFATKITCQSHPIKIKINKVKKRWWGADQVVGSCLRLQVLGSNPAWHPGRWNGGVLIDISFESSAKQSTATKFLNFRSEQVSTRINLLLSTGQYQWELTYYYQSKAISQWTCEQMNYQPLHRTAIHQPSDLNNSLYDK